MTKEQKQQAAYLLLQYTGNRISAKEEALLFQLLQEEKDAAAWQEIMEEMMAAEAGSSSYSKEEWQPVIDHIMQQEGHDTIKKDKLRRLNWRRMAVAAGIIGLLLAGYWVIESQTSAGNVQSEAAVAREVAAPEKNRAMITLADGTIIYLDSVSNGQLTDMNGVVVKKLEDGKISYQLADGHPQAADAYNTLTNPRGSRVIDMQLSDGSHVWLNAGSSITYPVAFTGRERKVKMAGEAYFEIQKSKFRNQSSPFLVEANGVTTEVLGTHFNVNAYDDEDAIRVTLLEGSVRVTQQGQHQMLKPGEQVVAGDQQLTMNKKVDLEEVMAWKNGAFAFRDAGIRVVVKELARWYDLDVEFKGEIPPLEFSGEIGRSLQLSEVLDGLQLARVHYTIRGRKLTILP